MICNTSGFFFQTMKKNISAYIWYFMANKNDLNMVERMMVLKVYIYIKLLVLMSVLHLAL